MNIKTPKEALQAITKLTIGNSKQQITVSDFAFSTSAMHPTPIEFTKLEELYFNSNVTFGKAMFGVNNTSAVDLEGAKFPALQTITFNERCVVSGSELFGAFSSNGSATAAELSNVHSIVFKSNTLFSGDNLFGIGGSSAEAPHFQKLSLLIFESTSSKPTKISGNQLFGASDPSLMSMPFDVLQEITFLRGAEISGNNAFAHISFPKLTLIAFQADTKITGTQTFNPITTMAQANVCIESFGIEFGSSTFKPSAGQTELTDLEGATGTSGSISNLKSGGVFNFVGAAPYGNCDAANFPGEIVFTDLQEATPTALASKFVSEVNAGNTNIRFMQNVPAQFHGMPHVDAVLGNVTHLSFGPGITVHDQAFGYSDALQPKLSIPSFNNLRTITFEKGSIASGDQIFGVFAKAEKTQNIDRTIALPRLIQITFEDKVQITGDDLFGTSAGGHFNVLLPMPAMHTAQSHTLFPVLDTISIGNDVVISGDRMFGSANYTGSRSFGAYMPKLTSFEAGKYVHFKGDCFLGAKTHFFEDPPKADSQGGYAFGARIRTLEEIIIGDNAKIEGDCFLGAASPKGGSAFGAVLDHLKTFMLGKDVDIKGDNFFGASETSLTEEPKALAVGAYLPRLENLNIGENINIGGGAAFGSKRSGYSLNKAFPPTVGTISKENGSNTEVIKRLQDGGFNVNGLTPAVETQTTVKLGAGCTYQEGTFRFAGSGSNVSPVLAKLENSNSEGTKINFVDGSSIGISNDYDDSNGEPFEKGKDAVTQNLAVLLMMYAALALATWMAVVVSGPAGDA